VVAAIVGAGGVRAAETVATNIDLMQQLTADVVRELHGKFAATTGNRPVRLKPAGTTEDYTFVTNVFTEELTRLGMTTIEPSTAGAPVDSAVADAVTLKYQNVVFELKYLDSHRSYLIGGKRVNRMASVRIITTVTAADGRVLWVGEASKEYTDELDYGDTGQLEQGNYAFNHPVVPSSGWGRYAEPVFVTGIIVGLIYLFFSNQSDN
jgi:hypothetical protein